MATLNVTWTQYEGIVNLFADVPTHTETPMSGTLTCDHAASSYGQPVVVTDDGAVLGSADVKGELIVACVEGQRLSDEEMALLGAARVAGFQLMNF